MAVKNYDARAILITLGAIPVAGFVEGTFCAVAKNEDAFVLKVGAGGEASRSRTVNDSAKITFTLMQTSASNDLLSALHNADKLIPGGVGVVPLLIRDLLGRTLYAAESAWIVKDPDAEFADEAGDREWTIETDKLDSFVGGNF